MPVGRRFRKLYRPVGAGRPIESGSIKDQFQNGQIGGVQLTILNMLLVPGSCEPGPAQGSVETFRPRNANFWDLIPAPRAYVKIGFWGRN